MILVEEEISIESYRIDFYRICSEAFRYLYILKSVYLQANEAECIQKPLHDTIG